MFIKEGSFCVCWLRMESLFAVFLNNLWTWNLYLAECFVRDSLAFLIIAVFLYFNRHFGVFFLIFTGILWRVAYNHLSIRHNHSTHHCVSAKSCVYQMTPSRITWRCPWLSDASQMSQLRAGCYCRQQECKKKRKPVKRRAVATKFRPSQWELQLTVDIMPRAKQKSHWSIMRETGKTMVGFFFVSPACHHHFTGRHIMNTPTTCVSVVWFLLSQHVLSSVSSQFADHALCVFTCLNALTFKHECLLCAERSKSRRQYLTYCYPYPILRWRSALPIRHQLVKKSDVDIDTLFVCFFTVKQYFFLK